MIMVLYINLVSYSLLLFQMHIMLVIQTIVILLAATVCTWATTWYLGAPKSNAQSLGQAYRVSTVSKPTWKQRYLALDNFFMICSCLYLAQVYGVIYVSSIAMASNHVFHSRAKHLEDDYYYIREKVIRGELFVNFICSEDQVANLFTQRLSTTRFQFFLDLFACGGMLDKVLSVVSNSNS